MRSSQRARRASNCANSNWKSCLAGLLAQGITKLVLSQLLMLIAIHAFPPYAKAQTASRAAESVAARSRVTQRIDNSKLVQLKGHVPRMAQAQYDRGPVVPSFELHYVTLLLSPTAEQLAAIDSLLAEQQDPASPSYHQWLTPEDYADRFGISQADINRITDWLQSEGFQIVYTARGRDSISFSGAARQIEQTFHTSIHRYAIDGETHFANNSDPSVPVAFAGIVGAISGLDDFRPKAPRHRVSHYSPNAFRPDYNDLNGRHFLAPDDIATIYGLTGLYNAGIDGTGQKIAVVGQSDFFSADISAFRSLFHLPDNPPKMVSVDPNNAPGVILEDSDEAELDLE